MGLFKWVSSEDPILRENIPAFNDVNNSSQIHKLIKKTFIVHCISHVFLLISNPHFSSYMMQLWEGNNLNGSNSNITVFV